MQGEGREQWEEMLLRPVEGRSERRVYSSCEALQVLIVYEGDMYMVRACNVSCYLELERIKLTKGWL